MINKAKTKEQSDFVSVKKYKALEKKANELTNIIVNQSQSLYKLHNIVNDYKSKICDCSEQKELLKRSNELKLIFLDKRNEIKQKYDELSIKYDELVKTSHELIAEKDENLLKSNSNIKKIADYELRLIQFKSMSLFEFLIYKYAK
jgi:hypothetical protein